MSDAVAAFPNPGANAAADPNEFVEFAFADASGRGLRQSRVHRELQAFLTEHPKALIELPRDHGKSVQVCARVLWELGRDPSLRVRIVCATEALAADRSRFLRDAITDNLRVRAIFPQLRRSSPWSDVCLTIRRPANAIGPSVHAFGIGASSTGMRADLLICDDIVDIRSVGSKSERERIKDTFRSNLMNLLEPDGRFWNLFTPWHRNDLNGELRDNPAFSHFRRAVGEDLEPVWPERWTRERLAERRREIGEVSFARGYRLLPLSDETVAIPADWIRFTDRDDEPERVILSVDPAISTKRTADASALVVLGADPGLIRVLETTARRVAMPDLVRLIDDADRRWNPEAILFESNAAFAGIRDLLAANCTFGAKLRGIAQSKDKATRVRLFSVPVQNGTFRLKGSNDKCDPSQRELYDEMLTFPMGEHDDLIDAAATGAMWLLDRREPRIF